MKISRITQTFKQAYPTYSEFSKEIEINNILKNFDTEVQIGELLVKGNETIFEHLTKAYGDRLLRFSKDYTSATISRYYQSTMPSFIIKTAYLNKEFEQAIKDSKMRGLSVDRSSDTTTTNDSQSAESTTPFNEVGSKGDEGKDKPDNKSIDKTNSNSNTKGNSITADYLRNISKLNSAGMKFPLMNFINQFEGLFVQGEVIQRGGIY